MTLGEFFAVIGSYPHDDNILKLPIYVHSPGLGENDVVDAECFLVTNEKTGEKFIHFDAPEQKEQHDNQPNSNTN